MTGISSTPTNTNYLQPSKFQILFPRITTVSYFAQKVNIPGVETTPAMQSTPFKDLPRPGDKLRFGTFTINFVIDEEMWNWEIIYHWLRGMTFPCSFEEYKNMDRLSLETMESKQPQYSDAYLSVLSGLNNPKVRFKFWNVFPIGLSDVNFDVEANADTVMTASATFAYHIYNIERG